MSLLLADKSGKAHFSLASIRILRIKSPKAHCKMKKHLLAARVS